MKSSNRGVWGTIDSNRRVKYPGGRFRRNFSASPRLADRARVTRAIHFLNRGTDERR
jgi:hypothetical protein